MAERDLYEELCKYYEMNLPIPRREEFKKYLPEIATPEELRIFFLLPAFGSMTFQKLRKKADLSFEDLSEKLRRLESTCLVLAYETPKGLTYERGNVVAWLTKKHICHSENTPRHTFFAELFNAVIEGEVEPKLLLKTCGFRVLPDEATLTGNTQSRTIEVDLRVPDTRQVLPVDIVSEVIKREKEWIAVCECQCRKAKRLLGQGCDHPIETCLHFNEYAQSMVRARIARKIDYQEAIDIVRQCEEAGLIHNADNCMEKMRTLCNCCSCCCAALKPFQKWHMLEAVISPSRYIAAFDESRCNQCEACIPVCFPEARAIDNGHMTVNIDQCFGCGLCVSVCPEGANEMVLKEKPPKIPRTREKLYSKLGREAMVYMLKKKVLVR